MLAPCTSVFPLQQSVYELIPAGTNASSALDPLIESASSPLRHLQSNGPKTMRIHIGLPERHFVVLPRPRRHHNRAPRPTHRVCILLIPIRLEWLPRPIYRLCRGYRIGRFPVSSPSSAVLHGRSVPGPLAPQVMSQAWSPEACRRRLNEAQPRHRTGSPIWHTPPRSRRTPSHPSTPFSG